MPREHRLQLLAAFLAVYVIWGSTYLGIRFAIETLPPFLMAGTRFLIAGAFLVIWARTRGTPWPSRDGWRVGAVVGLLLLLVGNGGVTWAELTVPSSITAVLVAAEPLWIGVFDWLRPGGGRPGPAVAVGLMTGFVGVALLVAPTESDAAQVNPGGAAVILAATMSWAVGSLYSRTRHASPSPIMATGASMLCGGAALLAVSLLAGEPARFAAGAVSARSLAAFAYLVVFGSLVAFTAYVWLLRHTTPAKAATYAYVNPVIAVLLGWLVGDEPLTARTLLATGIIIASVVTITSLAQLAPVSRRLAALVRVLAGHDRRAEQGAPRRPERRAP